MCNQYDRILKLRRWRELQKTLQSHLVFEQARAAERVAGTSEFDRSPMQQTDLHCDVTTGERVFNDGEKE